MTRAELREKAEAVVRLHTPPDYMPRKLKLTEDIESFGLEIAKSVAEECAKIIETEFAPAYVEEIFPEVPMEYIKEHSSVITGASGRMGRHLCKVIPEKIREYAKRLEGEHE